MLHQTNEHIKKKGNKCASVVVSYVNNVKRPGCTHNPSSELWQGYKMEIQGNKTEILILGGGDL